MYVCAKSSPKVYLTIAETCRPLTLNADFYDILALILSTYHSTYIMWLWWKLFRTLHFSGLKIVYVVKKLEWPFQLFLIENMIVLETVRISLSRWKVSLKNDYNFWRKNTGKIQFDFN